MLFWSVQMGKYRRRCALLSGWCGCEGKRWVAAAKRAVTQKLLGHLSRIFPPESWREDKENTVAISPNGQITPKMCSVEWMVRVRRCKMSCCSKTSCNSKTIGPFNSIFFSWKLTWRQREFCFDRSKRADIAKDVLCWVEGVGVCSKTNLWLLVMLFLYCERNGRHPAFEPVNTYA